MPQMERLVTQKIVCKGGLNSNQNYLELSDNTPGAATTLVNYEPSLYGGYRRINGFTPLDPEEPEVDPNNAEGKILGLFIFDGEVIAARKLQSGATYTFYEWSSGWTDLEPGLTLTSTNVNKIRHALFNFDGNPSVILTDGVNNATLFNGTTWINIDPNASGADYANAGGDQAVATPKYVSFFKNHLFVAGDATHPHVVSHSAPSAEYDWTSGNGGGQIVAGFEVTALKPFRDELYVFGNTQIKKITASGDTFVINDVTSNVGCIAPDSIVEINGDLLFLSQDGFRTIAGTERIGDIELSVLSKDIQLDVTDLISATSLQDVNAVVIRKKSQVRIFFSNDTIDTQYNNGIIGGLISENGGVRWEWGRLRGIRTSCAVSGYVGAEEYVLHGDFNGKVYRQEIGSSFDGANILAVYTTPYLDFGDVLLRKTLRKLFVFFRPEGELQINVAVQYDWDSKDVLNPVSYVFDESITGAVYGTAVYGIDTYASSPVPYKIENIQGSGDSVRVTFTSNDTRDSYSIQTLVFELSINGRK